MTFAGEGVADLVRAIEEVESTGVAGAASERLVDDAAPLSGRADSAVIGSRAIISLSRILQFQCLFSAVVSS